MSKKVQIEIQAKGCVVSDELKHSIYKRISHSFKFHKRKVRKVIVRLFNTVGSRGQRIKSCRVQTVANGIPQLITEKHSDNLIDAINSSISVASRSVAKYLRKLKNFKHIKTQPTHRRLA